MEKLINTILEVYRKNLEIDENQEAVLKYSLNITISAILGYVVALMVAWPLGIFSYVFVIMTTGAILRSFSGGAHCSSMFNCVTYGMLITNLLGILTKMMNSTSKMILSISFCIFVFALWAVNKYAPADTAEKPITSKVKIRKLRIKSLIFVCLWYFTIIGSYMCFKKVHIMMLATSLGILWQCLSITKIGYKLWDTSDVLLNKVFRRGGEYI